MFKLLKEIKKNDQFIDIQIKNSSTENEKQQLLTLKNNNLKTKRKLILTFVMLCLLGFSVLVGLLALDSPYLRIVQHTSFLIAATYFLNHRLGKTKLYSIIHIVLILISLVGIGYNVSALIF